MVSRKNVVEWFILGLWLGPLLFSIFLCLFDLRLIVLVVAWFSGSLPFLVKLSEEIKNR